MPITCSSSRASSSRFTALYDSLPQDAQQTLVYKHLIPLLDAAPKIRSRKASSAASALRRRHARIPQLDLRSKEAEIAAMLKELAKDAKRSCVTDQSLRVELLGEIVGSVAAWLPDIWKVAYEHNVNFALVHDCLLFVSSTLDKLATIRMGCKCSLNSIYIPVVLTSLKGRRVKRFDLDGASHIEEVTLFIWRETLLSMFAYGSQRQKDLIPKMLSDIEYAIGWRALVRLLYGGKKDMKINTNDDSEDAWEDVDVGDDESVDVRDDGLANFDVTKPPLMRHWSDSVARQLPILKQHIEAALVDVFEASPSAELYGTLLGMTGDPISLDKKLLESLQTMAIASPETYAVALEIYSSYERADLILDLLDHHSHMLRARNAPALQAAVALLSRKGHHQRALQILEAEMLDTVRIVRQALLPTFSQMETAANKAELALIVKQRSGAPGRQNRIEAWVDSITTPGVDTGHPAMFAAMFMGIAPMPGMNPDDDPYTYLDLDPIDPDLEDLRAEYRPDLKKRFQSWADEGLTLTGGARSLLSVYKAIVDILPFLLAGDVAEEVIGRLQDRPSKKHVCDGLDAVLAFVKVQRRKWRVEKRKATAARPSSQSTHNHLGPTPSASSSRSTTRFMGPAPTPSDSPPSSSAALPMRPPLSTSQSGTVPLPSVDEPPLVPDHAPPTTGSLSALLSGQEAGPSTVNYPPPTGGAQIPATFFNLFMGLGPLTMTNPEPDDEPAVGGVDDVD